LILLTNKFDYLIFSNIKGNLSREGTLMKKSMTVASLRLVLGLCLIVLFFVIGNVTTVKAADTQSLEGEWVPTSSNAWWDSIMIIRQDGGYNVTVKLKPNVKRQAWEGLYQGNATQIIASRNIPSENFANDFPAPVIRALAGKINYKYRFTLSSDGHSAEFARDNLGVNYYQKTGQMHDYFIAPFAHKTTLVRAPEQTPAQKQLTPAVAQVESRGEYYVLTKDGRKLTGKDANQIPLEEGTKVITGSSGHVRMKLPDDTTFTMGPNSDMVIDSFIYDPDNTPKKVIASVSKGVFRWVSGKVKPLQDPSEMKVKLPVIHIGIRGTDFEATVKPDGGGFVILHFGQLEITEKKTDFTFILDAGHKVIFDVDGSVSRPIKAD
jgi:hypothetical protein